MPISHTMLHEAFYPERQEPDKDGNVLINKETYMALLRENKAYEQIIKSHNKETDRLKNEIKELRDYKQYFDDCQICQRVHKAVQEAREWDY